MSPKKAVILYNELSANPTPDEADVLEQVNIIAENLKKLGVEYSTLTFSLNMKKVESELLILKPDFVFNMVEGVDNKGDLIFLAPALLNSLKIPFTGGSLETIFITSSKTLAKERMKQGGLPTAYWYHGEGEFVPKEGKRYIVKPIWEDGSLGLDEDCVFWWNQPGLMKAAQELNPATHFIEEYIDGREFNISILAGPNGPTVLPHAEIKFYDYEGDKPKMMGWTAKWKEDSFEYENTRRTFEMGKDDGVLLSKLTDLTRKSWDVFKLNGYARVDYRVDKDGNPMVLEINVNPCISENGGFYAACGMANIPFNEAVSRIINDIPSNKR
jgi:D-alanine-D-alanine ligase